MKKLVTMLGLLALLSGCSWFGHEHGANSNNGGSSITGMEDAPGRGTTGVGSGAGTGPGVTGSDAAPPR